MKKTTHKRHFSHTFDVGERFNSETNCPPALTGRVKRALLKEIKNFKARHVHKSEISSKHEHEKTGAYESWIYFHGGNEPVEANPDVLSDEEGIKYISSKDDNEKVRLLTEVRQLFTPRELQIWNIVMKHGMSISETAQLLNISKASIQTYLKRAKTKFIKFMEYRKND